MDWAKIAKTAKFKGLENLALYDTTSFFPWRVGGGGIPMPKLEENTLTTCITVGNRFLCAK